MQYSKLAELYQELEKTSKRLEKTHIISEFLKKIPADDLDIVTLLLQGRVFPQWDETKIGVASKLVIKAISIASGIELDKINQEWKKTGDIGDVAKNLIKKKKQATLFSQTLTVKKVFDNIRKLAEIEGEGSVDRKLKLIAELLTSAKSDEAKYIARTVLEDLRVGVADGTLRDAIVWAFFGKELKIKYHEKDNKIELDEEQRKKYNEYVNALQQALDASNDFGIVAKAAKQKGLNGLASIKLKIGVPIKVMLAQKAKDPADAFERVGKPAEFEYKMDGFRIQIHRDGNDIKLFTRRLDDVTKQFPDVVKFVKEHIRGNSFILDSEAVGFDPKTKKYLPFQKVSQRIRRKYDIDQMSKRFPVEVNVFDIISYKNRSFISEEFKKRRELLEKIVKQSKHKLVLAKKLVTSEIKDVDKFFKESRDAGNEGLMAKKLDAPYKPGSRVGYMVKLKTTMETLDLVIVGAEWGEGKRSRWLSSFTLACTDGSKFLEIGKVGTGIKEKEEGKGEGVTFEELTKKLKPLIIEEKGKSVKIKPKIVVEVGYEEIQKSPTYSSKYALRFPRVIKLRPDKSASSASELDYVEELFHEQKK